MFLQTDPGMVSFLKKRQQNRETNKSTKKEPMSSDYEMETVTANTLIQEQDANTKATSETDKSANLPVKPDTTWVNMDKIEYDKLEWTKALPAPKAGDKSTGQPVRFDFKVRFKTHVLFLRVRFEMAFIWYWVYVLPLPSHYSVHLISPLIY